MSDDAVEAAARDDSENLPLDESDFRKLRRVPRVKTLRRTLGLTQEEFSARYCIPLGTLRDWEQGRSEPDQPARAYLVAIAHYPQSIENALQRPLPVDQPEEAAAIAEKPYLKGFDGRMRDSNGEFGRKHGNTLVGTLRKTYGSHFAAGFRSEETLDTVLKKEGFKNLDQYLKHKL